MCLKHMKTKNNFLELLFSKFYPGNFFHALCSKMLIYKLGGSTNDLVYAVFLSNQKNTEHQISLLNTHISIQGCERREMGNGAFLSVHSSTSAK